MAQSKPAVDAQPTEREIKASKTLTTADIKPVKIHLYTSPTCGPCRQYKPALLEEAQKRGIEVVQVVLADDTRDEFMKLGIRNVPVTIVKREEAELIRLVGVPSNVAHQLDQWGL